MGVRIINKADDSTSNEVVKNYITVEAETVKKGSLSDYTILTGTTSSQKTVHIIPTMPAEVEEISVQIGDKVKEGDVLFKLEKSSANSQVTMANAGLLTASAGNEQANFGIKNAEKAVKQAEIGYQLAKANYDMNYEKYLFSVDNLEKYETLYNEGIVSETEYEQIKLQASETTLELLEKQLEQAEQALSQANLGVETAKVGAKQAEAGYIQAKDGYDRAVDALNDMTFEAPIDGYITAINIVEDAFASNAGPAMTIDAMDIIKVNINVTENIINKLVKGQNVEVLIDSLGEQVFKGEIKTINPSSDSRTLLYAISIEIQNDTYEIKPGMFADIKIKIEEVKDILYVKSNAVLGKDGKTYVYIIDDNEAAKLREVEVGLDNGDYVEVIKGLNKDEIIITKGLDFIDDETLLKVVRGDN